MFNVNDEKRVRRLAAREGLRLHKLRGQGNSYWLIDNDTNAV